MAEKLKNLLLAVLLLLMIALLGASMMLSMRDSRGGVRLAETFEKKESPGVRLTASQTAAFPEKLGLLTEEGCFYALEGEDYRLLWQQVRPLYEEALGSGSGLTPMSEETFRHLLTEPAVLLQYHADLPFYLLQDWGGTESDDETPVRSAALTLSEGSVFLLLSDGEGNRWSVETAASAAQLESVCGGWTANASLAGESYAQLDWEELLTNRVIALSGLSAQTPEYAQRGELPQRVMTLLSMNAFLTKVYPNADGSLVYVESHGTVRLTPEGDLHYTGASADLELAEKEGAAARREICQKVYALLEQLWQVTGASGRLSLETIREEEDGTVLRFALENDGLFLQREEGSWATAQVKNGVLTELYASPRVFSETEETLLLPMIQGAAALPQGKARVCVRLIQQGTARFVPTVCRVAEE